MKKLFKQIIAVILITTVVSTSNSMFLFANGINNQETTESVDETSYVNEELTNDEYSETDADQLETSDVVDDDQENEVKKTSDAEESEIESYEEDETKLVDEEKEVDTTSDEEENIETDKSLATEESVEENAEEENSVEDISESTSSEVSDNAIEENKTEDTKLLGTNEDKKGYEKNIPIIYNLDGGEWTEDTEVVDEFGHPYLLPQSTDEIEELANGEEFYFAVKSPRKDNYRFKHWKIKSDEKIRFFMWDPNKPTGSKLAYALPGKYNIIFENDYDEIELVAVWEYRMDTITYDKFDTNSQPIEFVFGDLETDFSKTDYVGYIDDLRKQVLSAVYYIADIAIVIDGVEVGKLVADFGGRFDRENYVCNESFVYVFARDMRDIPVKYDLAGGNWATIDGKVFNPNIVRAKSEIFELPALDKVEKENSAFIGWKIKGTDEIIDKLEPGEEEVELIATYERTHSKITYDLNGGRWVINDESDALAKKRIDEEVSLPAANTVYKYGQKLVGWKVNGEGEALKTLGNTDDDIFLVAEWTEVEMRKKELASYVNGSYDVWYKNAPISKEEIKSIIFTYTAPKSYTSSWNINADDIVGYVTNDNDVYVCAKEDVQIVLYPVEDEDFYSEKHVLLFNGFTNLEKIANIGFTDASELYTMYGMFANCENLSEIDFTGFNTGNVIDFSTAFTNTGFEELDLSMLDLNNVEMYQDAFSKCKKLRILNINIASKNYFYSALDMFLDCPNLIAVFVPDDFAGSDVAHLFSHLSDEYNYSAKLNSSVEKKERKAETADKTIQYAAEFKIGTDDNEGVFTAQSYAPAQIGKIIYDFKGLKTSFVNPKNIYDEKLYGRKFYLPLAEEMIPDKNAIFMGWYRDSRYEDGPIDMLSTDESGDITVYAKWEFPKIKWYTINGGKELHLTSENIPSDVDNFGNDFYASKKDNTDLPLLTAEKIVIDDKVNINDEDLDDDVAIFGGFEKVKVIEGLTNFDLSNLQSLARMFENCKSLETIDLTGLSTANVQSFELMFANTSKLRSVKFGNINTSKVKNMSYMFSNSSVQSVDFGTIDTSNVEDMSCMFYNANKLDDVKLNNFNTLKVKNYSSMFNGCTSLQKLDISSFAFTFVEGGYNFNSMFKNCENLVTIIATKEFDLFRLRDDNFAFISIEMFAGCKSLAGEKGGFVDSKKTDTAYYADIAHLDGAVYNILYNIYTEPKMGVFSTKDTSLVTFKYLGNVGKEDVKVGHVKGEKINLYVEPGTDKSHYKYYTDENKNSEVPFFGVRAMETKVTIYIEYSKPANNISNKSSNDANQNNLNYRTSSRSSGSSGGGSSGGGYAAGPLSDSDLFNSPTLNDGSLFPQAEGATEAEQLSKTKQEISPNAITKQENAKTAVGGNYSIANNLATWEENSDGTWSLSVNVNNQNVDAKNAFYTLIDTDATTGVQTNSIYYFDEKGQMATGWIKDNSGSMYFFETAYTADVGKMITGWKQVSGVYYYFGSDGKMMTNGITPDGYTVGANGEWLS